MKCRKRPAFVRRRGVVDATGRYCVPKAKRERFVEIAGPVIAFDRNGEPLEPLKSMTEWTMQVGVQSFRTKSAIWLRARSGAAYFTATEYA